MWRNMPEKLEWLLIVVVLGWTVMLSGCGGGSSTLDPGTKHISASDKVFTTSIPKNIIVWLMDWQGNQIQERYVQAEFTIVSYTSSVTPTITDVVQNPYSWATTANFNTTEPGTYVIKASIGGMEKIFTYVVMAIDAGSDRTVVLGSTVTLTGNISPAIPAGLDIYIYDGTSKLNFEYRSYWKDTLNPFYSTGSYSYHLDNYYYLYGTIPLLSGTMPLQLLNDYSATIEIDSSNGDVASFTASVLGQHEFYFCADPISISGFSDAFHRVCDPVTITVVEPTIPPVANAGSTLTVAVGDAVTLSGSASSDTYSLPLIYSWSIASMPVGSAATLTNATTVSPSFTADLEGDYVFNLVVNNGYLDSASASVTITASPLALPNTAPVADAGLPQNAAIGGTVTLDGSASSDANSDPLTYAWTLTTLPASSVASLTGNTTAAPTFVPDVDGDYVATLLVNDGTVNSAADTVTVTVAAAATGGPITTVAALENALANNTFLLWHSSAPNGLLELYEFGSPGPGGSVFNAYISPMSAPSSHTREWSVTDKGTYIEASETSPFYALNTAAAVDTAGILTMTGYAGNNGNLGGSPVESWIKAATVTAADFTGKTVMLDSNTINQFVFSTATTGQYTDGNGNTQLFTWGIDSGGHKAVVTLNNGSGFTRSLYLTVRQAGMTLPVREMGVVSADNVGTVTDGSLQNWMWQ